MFKLIIAGGRDFNDFDLMITSFRNYMYDNRNIGYVIDNKENIEIISGTANGADKLGERLANRLELKCRLFPANWGLYGKSAGYKRNAEMAEYADGLLAFWDGKSKGTKHMIDLANKKNLIVKVVKY